MTTALSSSANQRRDIHPVREQTIMDQRSAVGERVNPAAARGPLHHINVKRIECPRCESLLSPAGVVTLDEYDDPDYGGRIRVIATYCPLCDRLVEFYLLVRRGRQRGETSSYTTVFTRAYQCQERIDRFLKRYPEARAVTEL